VHSNADNYFLWNQVHSSVDDVTHNHPSTLSVICALIFPKRQEKDDKYMIAYIKSIRSKTSCCYISCEGTLRSVWDITSLCFVLFCTFSIPFDMSFEPGFSNGVSIFQMIIEAFFIIEIILNFFTSIIDPDDGMEITNHLLIAVLYSKTWLPLDIVASIPSEIVTRIYMATTVDGGAEQLDALARLRIIRILRLSKLLRLLRLKQMIDQIELAVPAMRTVFGLFRLLCMTVILGHWQACGFYVIGRHYNLSNSWISKYHANCCDTNTNWSVRNDGECYTVADLPRVETLYTNAIYWSFTTLTSVGYGDFLPCNEAEMLYCLSCMLLGSAMFAYIVGNISEVVSVAGGQKDELKSRMRQLQEYINARKLPKEVCIVCILFQFNTRLVALYPPNQSALIGIHSI